MTRPTIDDIRMRDGSLPPATMPGLYPIVYLDGQGSTLCPDCANADDGDPSVWPDQQPRDWYIYYEGPAIYCDECGEAIESAYGDPEETRS